MKTIVLAMSLFAGACSTLPRQETRHVGSTGADLRGDLSVHARRAKALVSGPAVIQHLDTTGEGTLTLYLTDDPGIGDRGCTSAAAEQSTPVAILTQQSRITDLFVPGGKRVCAALEGARSKNVAWHARAAWDQELGFNLALLGPGASR